MHDRHTATPGVSLLHQGSLRNATEPDSLSDVRKRPGKEAVKACEGAVSQDRTSHFGSNVCLAQRLPRARRPKLTSTAYGMGHGVDRQPQTSTQRVAQGQPEAMFHTLLVPLDGSALAEQALPLAMNIARRANAKLDLVRAHVLYAFEHPAYGWAPFDPAEDAEFRKVEQGYLDRL